jgi:ACS family D-galactonate transporter-like MFS transporter
MQSIDRRAWLIVAMLFLFMLINFADKAVLGLAAGPIIRDLKLTHTQFGRLGSAFFLLFSISSVLVGFLLNRASTKWTLAAMALVWALAQIPMAFALGAPALIASRIALGAGEGPAYPAALHAIYKWIPNERRPLPTSIINIGGAVGAGVAAPAITFIILRYSWHAAFGLLGLLGLAWVFTWSIVGREGPLEQATGARRLDDDRLPYWRLLTCRTVIGNFIVGFSAYWLLTLGIVWLPNYLHLAAGYDVTTVGWLVTLPSLLQIVAIPLLCAVSEKLKRKGVSSRVSRGLIGAGSVFVAGILTFALPFAHRELLLIVCLTGAFAVGSTTFTMGAVLVAELTPVSQRGAMLCINTAVSTTAGVFAPITMGIMIDHAASSVVGFRMGFMVIGALVAAASLLGAMLINPEADIRRLSRRRSAGTRRLLAPHAVAAEEILGNIIR